MDDLLICIKAKFVVIERDYELWITTIHGFVYSSVYLEV